MLKIKRANNADAKAIAKLNAFVHELHVAAHPKVFKPCDVEEKEKHFKQLLGTESSLFYLAYVGELPVGYVWAKRTRRPEDALMYEIQRIYIHHISVDIEHRRKGIAIALIQAITDLAKESGIKEIALDAWSFNEEAIGFFKGKGFEIYNVCLWKEI